MNIVTRFLDNQYDIDLKMSVLLLPILLIFFQCIRYCRYNTSDIADFQYHKSCAGTDPKISTLLFTV